MSITNRAIKCRIYPNEEQKVFFAKTFGCSRLVYNKMLELKSKHYSETGKALNITPAMLKPEFPFLKEVDSLALANAQLNLQSAFSEFFKGKAGYPNFKKKQTAQKYTTNNQKGTIAVIDSYIKLPKIGLVKIKLHRQIPNDWHIKSATVSRNSCGKFYVSILFEFEHQVEPHTINNIVDLDFSMHELYLSSDGEMANYPKFYRKTQNKLAKEQRKLSKCVYCSNNYYKQKRKVAKIHEKIANQRKDFLHKLSRKITNSYDVVCIEDLNMKAMSQTLNFGKSVLDNGWGMFTTFLNYKLSYEGKYLVKVDKWFPSSQTCNICGYKNPQTKDLSIRKWICPQCNTFHDRDINAAINIKNEGVRLLLS